MSRTATDLAPDLVYGLLVAQLLVVLPHMLHLPLWIVALELGCCGWQWRIVRQQADYPSSLFKVLLVLSCVLAVYLSGGTLMGLEAATDLLVSALILKTLEMRSQRDALVVIFLGFFTLVTGYLFEDGLLAALYTLLPVALLLALLAAIQSPQGTSIRAHVKQSARALGQATPFMLLLFILVPRLEPLWHLPEPSQKGITGLSDRLQPEQITELAQSAEVAFRVNFDQGTPRQEQLYWRMITFGVFDGQQWLPTLEAQQDQSPNWQAQGPRLDYQIVMQPSLRPWVPVLDVPEQSHLGEARIQGDFHFEQNRPISRPILYRVQSRPQALLEPKFLSPEVQQRALQLPVQGNPLARSWGEALHGEFTDPTQRAQAILQRFHTDPFHYSLKTPAMGADPIDAFLFEHRIGFCAHYAQAMTFVLRAAGVPARIVAGYQGGRFNAEGQYWLVRQFDAHAWVEYWIEGLGWVRADPTFEVAPERIQWGFEQALTQVQRFLPDAPEHMRALGRSNWANQLGLVWDDVNHAWQRWVLNYQTEQQQRFLSASWQWLVRHIEALLGVMALFLVLAGAAWCYQQRRRRMLHPLQSVWRDYERQLIAYGITRKPAEGVRHFAQRAAQELPAQAKAIFEFSNLYELLCYGGVSVNPEHIKRLRQWIRQLKPT